MQVGSLKRSLYLVSVSRYRGLIVFLILLMSRSMEPIVFANSTIALATSSIFSSVVLFGLSADLAKDSADELLNSAPSMVSQGARSRRRYKSETKPKVPSGPDHAAPGIAGPLR